MDITIDTSALIAVIGNEKQKIGSSPIQFIDVPLERTLYITKQFNIYAYDAYLIQCAELTNSPLLSLDKNLITIDKQMGITVLEVTNETI